MREYTYSIQQYTVRHCSLLRRWTLGSRVQDEGFIWELPKIRDTLFWGPYNKDPTILRYYIRVPYFWKPHLRSRMKVFYCGLSAVGAEVLTGRVGMYGVLGKSGERSESRDPKH